MPACDCITEKPRFTKKDVVFLESEELPRITSITNALCDPIRIQILNFWEQQETICTCEFQELLGLPQSKVSYHLKILLNAGIIERQTISNWRHYRLINKEISQRIKQLIE
jgi:ArsR family transcriptional regulator, arsenate/arsenite/antimonite-responsive transcriptional repressor